MADETNGHVIEGRGLESSSSECYLWPKCDSGFCSGVFWFFVSNCFVLIPSFLSCSTLNKHHGQEAACEDVPKTGELTGRSTGLTNSPPHATP